MAVHTGKIPTGEQLLSTLIDLLADQEGVKITYEFKKEKEANELCQTGLSKKASAQATVWRN